MNNVHETKKNNLPTIKNALLVKKNTYVGINTVKYSFCFFSVYSLQTSQIVYNYLQFRKHIYFESINSCLTFTVYNEL